MAVGGSIIGLCDAGFGIWGSNPYLVRHQEINSVWSGIGM